MAPQLEAKYRISFLLDDAFKSLRQLKQGIAEIQGPAAPADALNKGIDDAEARVKKVASDQKAAARAAREEQREADRAARQAASQGNPAAAAQRQAAKEAAAAQATARAAELAATKAAAEEALRIKRAQLNEERRLADEARKAQRTAERKTRDEQRAAQKEANLSANQARMLAPQLTDITVGLATGQSPFTVLLQQGGQLKDMYGGVGNAFKALGSIFTVIRVLVGGLVGAIAGLVFAAAKGYAETDTLNKSLALTGNVAGVTAASLDRSARAIAASQKVSISSVREALTGAIETGAFVGPTLDSAGRAAVALSKLTGKAAAEQIKDFDALGNGVAEWAAKQNRAYNFLTVEEYKHIRSLEAAGREQEAMREVLDKLSATMEQRAAPAIGFLEKAWNAVKKAVSDAGEELKKIGREATPEEQIAALQARLAGVRSRNSGYNPANPKAVLQADAAEAALQAQLDPLLAQRNRDLLRQAELAIDMREVNSQIAREQKDYQDAIAQIDQAGGKKRLAQELAALDTRQSAIERANAQGLISATQYSVSLNGIEQRRAQAQLQQLERQMALESKRAVGKPIEEKAKQARLVDLEAQQIELQSRLRQLSAQGRGIIDAKALDDARSDAEKWAQTWQAAASQVRAFTAQNAEADAGRLADPVARAEAEARARVAATRQQLNELMREVELRISLTLDPGQKAELQRQLNELRFQGSQAIDNQGNEARLVSLRNALTRETDALRLAEQQLDEQVRQGTLTVEEAERRKFALRDQALVQLEAVLEALKKLSQVEGAPAAIESLKAAIAGLKDRTTDLQAAVRTGLRGEFSGFFSDIATGTKTAGRAFTDLLGNVAKSVLDLIGKRLGEKLFDSLFSKNSVGSNLLNQGLSWVASMFHEGGVVGGAGGTARSLGLGTVMAAAMAGLPYYHGGGISGAAGLRSNEELAVLEHGEEVLTADNPRHVKNFNSGGGTIGDVSVSVNVQGAQGEQGDLKGAGDRLGDLMLGVVHKWAAEESRQGGVLARRG